MEQTPTDVTTSLADEELARELGESADEIPRDRADRFYDRIRSAIQRYIDKKGRVLGKTAGYLLLVPDVFILLWRLATDARVSSKDKVLLGTAIAYYVSPFDLIPEALVGPIGYLDDLVFGVYVLNKMLTSTDPAILREHWSGSEDVLGMIQRVFIAADGLVGAPVLAKIKKLVRR